MPKPKPLTVAQVARMARRHDAAAWGALSAAERQQLADMLNEHAANSAAVNRLFKDLWAPVRREAARRGRG